MTQEAKKTAALLKSAQQARQQGNAGEEARILDEALRIAPADPLILNARGICALGDQDFEKAQQHFSAAVDADPKEPSLLINLATACRAAGNDAGERDSLNRALDLDRLNFMANLRLAELHERCGEAAAAALSWSHIVQMASGMEAPPPGVIEALRRGNAFLAKHNERLSAALDTELGADLARLGPGARRMEACIDTVLGRRRIYQNQCEGVHYPFLPADEFFDRAHFPWLDAVEAKSDAIRAEALALLENGCDAIRPYVRMEAGAPDNKWTPLDHNLDWSACFLIEYGERNEPVCVRCPETMAALALAPQNHIPGKAPSAFFSILQPGAHIPAHTGVTNTRAIIHLPLVVPEGCRFRVGGETRVWREGQAFAFDDTIDHEAWNDSDQRRIILIFDVWNPHLSLEEQNLLSRFFEISTREKL